MGDVLTFASGGDPSREIMILRRLLHQRQDSVPGAVKLALTTGDSLPRAHPRASGEVTNAMLVDAGIGPSQLATIERYNEYLQGSRVFAPRRGRFLSARNRR